MSEVSLEELKNELNMNKSNLKGALAQLEATKQMFNEATNTGLQLRTNLCLFQQNMQELVDKNKALSEQVSSLTNQLNEALQAKVNASLNEVDAA